MVKNELAYWLAFNQITSIGPVRLQKLLNYFGSLSLAWQAGFSEIISAGLEPKTAEIINEQRKQINPEQELEKVEKMKIKVITIQDENYPARLKEIYAPPNLIYYYGELNLNPSFTLAIVGSRKISDYGRQITSTLAKDLAQAGLTIVSGLALGVDACAQQAACQVGGKNVAVLGSGLNKIYPAQNRFLAQEILNHQGAVISEFPLGMPPLKHNFPLRNRIISGLSLGTLVTEASEKSGALITAQFALEQNREVFAVPGNIYQSGSVGTNYLIKAGAKVVTSAFDILETLNLEQAQNFKTALNLIPTTETEKIILNLLPTEPTHVDKIVESARLDISVVNANLITLEMKGLIKNLGHQKYIKAR